MTLSILVSVCVATLPVGSSLGQQAGTAFGAEDALAKQIELLNSPSYRTRQLARWRLEQQPLDAIAIIRQKIVEVDHHAGAQMVDLLTLFATQNEVAISLDALQILRDTSRQMSSIGKLADNSLQAIADLQEEQAIEILVHHSARIGPVDFNLNAQVGMRAEIALHIDERFTGDDETIQWIRFLKSVETVFFEGPEIDSRFFSAISELRGIRNVKLKHVTMSQADLALFRQFDQLEHLGLNYVDVDDSVLDILAELPMSESLRLFGTKISAQGAKRLEEQLDGIEIYCGRGGFLGVAMDPLARNTIVTSLTRNSGAEQAGIARLDSLTHINDVEIKTFDDLRKEMAKYVPDEVIRIKLRRGGELMDVRVTLTEEPAN